MLTFLVFLLIVLFLVYLLKTGKLYWGTDEERYKKAKYGFLLWPENKDKE